MGAQNSNKSSKWIFNNYWKHSDGRWTFYTTYGQNKSTTLLPYNLAQKKIRTRLSYKVNIFDLNNKDLIRKKQLAKKVYLIYKKQIVWRKQKALCPVCNQYLNPLQPDMIDLHHVIPRKDGGTDKYDNLKLLHEHCHYESHTNSIAS
jgi:RNA-directed DNA polymerase